MNIQIALNELKKFFCIGLSFNILGILGYITTTLFGEYGFLPIWLANLFLTIGSILCIISSIIYLTQTRILSQPIETSENEQVSIPSESNIPLTCPKCGTKLKFVPICSNCGYTFDE